MWGFWWWFCFCFSLKWKLYMLLICFSLGRREERCTDGNSLKSRGRSTDFTAMSNTYIWGITERLEQKSSYRRYGQNTKLHTVRRYSVTVKSRNKQLMGLHLNAASPLLGSTYGTKTCLYYERIRNKDNKREKIEQIVIPGTVCL